MLEYDRIDASKGIDPNKTTGLGHNWYFLEKNFGFQSNACNDCHDLAQKPMSFNHLAIVSPKRNDYRVTFCYMSKYGAKLFK